jgi:diguanylate cyclase (GGDEF)-like protein
MGVVGTVVLIITVTAGLAGTAWLHRARSRPAAPSPLPDPRAWQHEAAGRLTHLVSAGRPVAVLAINLDRINHINRRHGHAAGDALLAAVESTILIHAGPDALVTRLADDHFLLLLADDVLGAQQTAEEIGRAIRRLPVGSHSADVTRVRRPTASIGVAVYPQDGRTLHALVVAADVLVFAAKAAGRDRVQTARRSVVWHQPPTRSWAGSV